MIKRGGFWEYPDALNGHRVLVAAATQGASRWDNFAGARSAVPVGA
jgi:hypothetical protein